MRDATLYVCCSRIEGLGIAIVEAMACRHLAVICERGMAEFVENGMPVFAVMTAGSPHAHRFDDLISEPFMRAADIDRRINSSACPQPANSTIARSPTASAFGGPSWPSDHRR